MKIEILPDKNAVAARAAELFCEAAKAFTSVNTGTFSVALAGGSTPKLLYQMLSKPPWKQRVPWADIRWYLGDERLVPSNHAESNYRMIRENLFNPAGVPINQQFPMLTQLASPQETAHDYAQKLSDHLATNVKIEGVTTPVFDLLLLGMGDDGHTASLFPYTTALDETEKPVAANYVEKLNTWRITITPPVLMAARQRIVLVTGAEKAPALAEVLHGELNVKEYPAQLLRETKQTTWLVDEAAGLK